LRPLLVSWQRSLRARNLAPKTIKTYLEAASQLVDYVTAAGVESMAEIERHHVEDFIAEQIETRSAATASVRFRALQQLFTWCLDEEELDVNPMAKMRPPVVPERPVPVLGEDKARALLKACAGSGFVQRRDTAIVRLFLDTGMRLSELAKLHVDDIDLGDDVAIVTGKGRRPRACPFGSRTAQALDRYARARSRHPRAELPALWLGANGRAAMTDNGIAQMIRKPGGRGRHRGSPPAHAAPHVRPRLVGRGRQRGRPDAPGRMEEPPDAEPLRRQRRRPAGPGSPQAPRLGRSPVNAGCDGGWGDTEASQASEEGRGAGASLSRGERLAGAAGGSPGSR
jgi:integrase/recombinase XerC